MACLRKGSHNYNEEKSWICVAAMAFKHKDYWQSCKFLIHKQGLVQGSDVVAVEHW